MSIIFKGDILSNFGRYMPAPYIRSMAVKDDSIDVTMSVYINVVDGQNVEAMIGELANKINLGVYMTVNGEHFDSVVNRDTNIFDYYEGENFEADFLGTIFTINTQDAIIPVDNIFASDGAGGYEYLVNDDLYDEKGTRVWEFRLTHSIAFNFDGSWGDIGDEKYDTLIGLWAAYYFSKLQEWWAFAEEAYGGDDLATDTQKDDWYDQNVDMGVFVGAFSTTVDLADDEEIMTNLSNMSLLKTKISDVSYETVIERTAPQNFPGYNEWQNLPLPGMIQTEFLDMNDAIYDSVPLQSLDSRYHKTDHMTHESVVSYFNEMLKDFKGRGQKYPRLQKMMNQISYVLKVYGNKADLVPQLNFLRSVFPSKSTATPIGKLYRRFRKRIATVNKAIKRGSKLKKQQIRNPKIQDERTKEIDSFSAPAASDPDIDQEYIYSEWPMTIEYDSIEEVYTNYGYFFFDYEKALRRASAIAQAYDLQKIEDFLGIKIPYNAFQIVEATLSRTPGLALINITSYMSDAYGSPGYPATETVKAQNNSIDDENLIFPSIEGISLGGYAAEYSEWGFNTGVQVPMLVVRSPIAPNGTGLSELTGIEDYRLTVFEFQDYYRLVPEDPAHRRYGVNVTVYDKTVSAARKIEETYLGYQKLLREYKELADNLCSINDLTGEFNSFFTDAILEVYEDDLAQAPWIQAPVIYSIYRDIVFDTFDGDIEAISDYAMSVVENINPYNGTLEKIEAFHNDMKGLSDQLYTGDTPYINNIFDNLDFDTEVGGETQELAFILLRSDGVLWPAAYTTASPECGADTDCAGTDKCWTDGTCVDEDYCEKDSDCASGAGTGQYYYCNRHDGEDKCYYIDEEDTGTETGTEGEDSCFIAGTKITMSDGTKKNIEDIVVGDEVKTSDGVGLVTALRPTTLGNNKLYALNGDENYFVTAEHPFMTSQGWKSLDPQAIRADDLYGQLVGFLMIGDKMVTERGLVELYSIESKEFNEPALPLYNFSIDKTHEYYADGYLVHNKQTAPAQGFLPGTRPGETGADAPGSKDTDYGAAQDQAQSGTDPLSGGSDELN